MTTYEPTVRPAETFPRLIPAAETSGVRSAAWWGMVILIMNEAVIFAALIASYVYLHANSPIWPQGNLKRPDLLVPFILTGILLTSSGFMQWALSSIKKGHHTEARIGLGAAFILAAAFLALTIYEYTQTEFPPQYNAYASLYFAITGLHATHVLIAALMNLFIQARSWFGHFTARRHQAFDNVVLYWHFVDTVWLFVFTFVILSPYFQYW